MMKKEKSEKGLLSLEASIVVTIFLFLMLFLYSFFIVFEARNEMAHVLLASTNSMALDPYGNEKLTNSGTLAGPLSDLLRSIYGLVISPDKGFVSFEMWNQIENGTIDPTEWNGTIVVSDSGGSGVSPGGSSGGGFRGSGVGENEVDIYGNRSASSSLLARVIKERMIAYLADGDEAEADKILKRYHIVNGLDGLDFSGSMISSGNLYVKVRYTLEYEFDFWNLGTIEMEQSACSKLWK